MNAKDKSVCEAITKIANAALDGVGIVASMGGEITTIVTGGENEAKPDSIVLVCVGKTGCPVMLKAINELLASEKFQADLKAAGATSIDVGVVSLDSAGNPEWDKPLTKPKTTLDDVKKGAHGDASRN